VQSRIFFFIPFDEFKFSRLQSLDGALEMQAISEFFPGEPYLVIFLPLFDKNPLFSDFDSCWSVFKGLPFSGPQRK